MIPNSVPEYLFFPGIIPDTHTQIPEKIGYSGTVSGMMPMYEMNQESQFEPKFINFNQSSSLL